MMANVEVKNATPSIWIFHALAILLILYGEWFSFFSQGVEYADIFHDGEFVASLPAWLEGGQAFITIHGGLDWILSWGASSRLGDSRHFALTKFLHYVCNVLAALILYRIFWEQMRGRVLAPGLPLLALATLAPLLVGFRDVPLLLGVWIYLARTAATCNGRQAQWLDLLLGVTVALNLLWSFDRGMVGLFGFGFVFLAGGWSGRPHASGLLSLVLTLVLALASGLVSIQAYAENLLFLIQTSSQWSYGYAKSLPVLLTLLVAILNGWPVYFLVKILLRTARAERRQAVEAAFLLILTVLMFKIGINRADSAHVVMAMWMPILVFLYINAKHPVQISRIVTITTGFSFALLVLRCSAGGPSMLALPLLLFFPAVRHKLPSAESLATRLILIAFTILILCLHIMELPKIAKDEGTSWIGVLLDPPANESLVSEDIQWVVSEYRRSGASCVFDLSNSGVINGITGLPSCTRFTYPVYATRKFETEMLQVLDSSRPQLVVFSSTTGGFRIDERSMHARFPVVSEYLTDTYPHEQCWGRFCLRYRSQP